MNGENEIKKEFEEFIEDLVKDIIKSVLYEDFKDLRDKFNSTNKELQVSSKNINNVSNKLKENTQEINISIDKIVKSSDFLNNNIENLKNKIREDVHKMVQQSVADSKRNMSDLNKAISIMKDEIINQNRNNLNKLMDEISKLNKYLCKSINTVDISVYEIEKNIEEKITESNDKMKKFMLLISILSIVNILLIIYLLYSRA